MEGLPAPSDRAARVLSVLDRYLASPAGIDTVVRSCERDEAAALGFRANLLQALSRHFDGGGSEEVDTCLGALWLHAAFVGQLAEQLARHSSAGPSPTRAFCAGLLHDVGKSAMLSAMPRSYERVIRRVEADAVSWCDAELGIFGLDHTVAGRHLLHRWGIDSELADAVRFHHQPLAGIPESSSCHHLVSLVQLADAVAHRDRIGMGGDSSPADIDSCCTRLGITRDGLDESVAVVQHELAGLASSIALSSGPEFPAQERAGGAGDLQHRCAWDNAVFEFASRAHGSELATDVCRSAVDTAAEVLGVEQLLLLAEFGDNGQTYGAARVVGHSLAQSFVFTRSDIEESLSVAADSSDHPALFPASNADLRAWQLQGLARSRARLVSWHLSLPEGGTARFILDSGEVDVAQADRLVRQSRSYSSVMVMALIYAFRRQQELLRSDEVLTDQRRVAAASSAVARDRAVSMVGEMAAGAAHELNNPLANISGRAQLILNQPQDVKREQWARAIVEQADEATQIINDLVSYAKPAAPHPITVRVGDLLQPLLQHWQEGSGLRPDVLQAGPFDPDLVIRVDEGHFASIVCSVLDNARDAMESETAVLKINSPSRPADEHIRIVIADNGRGMERAVLEHAVDPFFSNRPAGRGRGLGLSLAYRLAKINGGGLWIESVPQLGTTVTLAFPSGVAAATGGAG
jgi:signal transduction histidine kinase/HD superfamily phosphohydrolase YqeK